MINKEISILIIRDRDLNSSLILQKLINSSNFSLSCVNSVEQALKVLSNLKFNAIIVDLNLKDKELIKNFLWLKNRSNNTPVIISSNNNNLELGIELIQRGAEDYIFDKDIKDFPVVNSILFSIERQKKKMYYENRILNAS